MSGIRISEFKKPKTIIVDQAKVDSAYGPKSSILLETTASSYSKAGFTVEVKGLSRDSLLNGLFVTVPIQVRWTGQNGNKLLLNQYANLTGRDIATDFASATSNQLKVNDALYCFDSVCVRPNPFKMIRNATLSINGSSFSTRTDAYYTAMCKLFADGRQEDITGCAYESYPYTNSGDRTSKGYQKGWFERCKALNNIGKVVRVKYVAEKIVDVVMQYDIKFPLWFGPFTHLGFPGLTGFDGQTVASIPYCNDIVLECSFTDDPLMDCFCCPDMNAMNCLSVQNPTWAPKVKVKVGDWTPNTSGMWASMYAGDITTTAREANQVGLLEPKLCYMFSEPDSDKMTIAPLYTLPSYRIISYETRVGFQSEDFASTEDTVRITFPYIRLSNISSLYVCMAEADRVDNGVSFGAKSGRQSSGAYSAKRLGMCSANRTCPIKWDTVKVSMSTQSQVLTNFTANTITPQRQFELFKKYSNDAMGLSFEAWQESSQMLLFSAEELCGIGAFANSYQSLTLSVEFEVYRVCTDTKIEFQDWVKKADVAEDPPHIKQGSARKGNDVRAAIVGRLIALEPELVSISEGAVSVEQVKLSQQEIHNQLMGGAPEIEDGNRLDQLAR